MRVRMDDDSRWYQFFKFVFILFSEREKLDTNSCNTSKQGHIGVKNLYKKRRGINKL